MLQLSECAVLIGDKQKYASEANIFPNVGWRIYSLKQHDRWHTANSIQ